ncbi:MAG TPA: hypothetical protein VFV38_05305 [Ktedonobacteraceae bacterium]|nr:hypothetical protein [Ktedonobacteraceae bacterium]
MRKRKPSLVSSASLPTSAQVFALPHLLPEHTHLLLDVPTRTLMVLHQREGVATPSLTARALTPSATRVVLALLQTAPHPCSYQTLFTALYPDALPPEQPAWLQEPSIRPIRRALATLAPALHAFGLAVVALRGHGYQLASIASHSSSVSTSPDHFPPNRTLTPALTMHAPGWPPPRVCLPRPPP